MNGILSVNRFNGVESWKITEGAFSISIFSDYFLFNLWGKSDGTRLLPPIEEGYDAEPTFELQMHLDADGLIDLHANGIEIDSKRIKTIDERDFAKLYYYGDIEIFSYFIKCVHLEKDKYQILVSCQAEDVIFTSAKPNCELNIDCQVIQSKEKTGYWT